MKNFKVNEQINFYKKVQYVMKNYGTINIAQINIYGANDEIAKKFVKDMLEIFEQSREGNSEAKELVEKLQSIENNCFSCYDIDGRTSEYNSR